MDRIAIARGQTGIVLLAFLLMACVPVAAPSPSGAAGEPSVYDTLFERVGSHGETDVALARDAFSLSIAPLPGVVVPQGGAPKAHEGIDGTFAIALVSKHWAELTPEQQAAIEHVLTPGPNEVVVGPDGQPANPVLGARVDQQLSAGGPVALAAIQPPSIQMDLSADADDATRARFLAILREAEALIGQKTGRAVGKAWALWMKGGPPLGDSLAATLAPGLPLLGFPFPRWAPGCLFITFDNTTQLGEQELRATLAHEMWHCYQASIAPADRFSALWIFEGQAEWAGEALMGPSSVGTGWWRHYVLTPERPLWERTYDANGFFWQLSEHGHDPFIHAKAMLEALGHTSQFGAAGARNQDFLFQWAAGLLRDPEVGAAWNTRALWDITDRKSPQEMRVSAGTQDVVRAGEVQNMTYRIVADTEVVQVVVDGHALIGAPGSPPVRAGQVWLCVSGMCECPKGTHRVGPNFVTMPSTFYMGVTGGLDGAEGTVIGHELREFCEPDAPPPPAGAPCGAGCSSSTGEPHLTTVDGVGYDFQDTGEYVLLRSPDGSFEVQSRQVPITADIPVSANSAVAMRAGVHRVAIYTEPGGEPALEVRLDGAVVDASTAIDLGGGGRVAAYSGGVQVDFADSSQLWAVPIGDGCCINILLAASDELTENGVGLLGNVTPGGARLPALPDGTRLPRPADRHEQFVQLYEQLGPAWLVTPETSLFDYKTGESTADFVTPDFPQEGEYRTIEDLPPEARAQGEALCAGVTDSERFLECVFDVSVADFIAWAEGYLKTVQLEEQGPVAIGAPVPQPPPPPPDELPAGFVRVTEDVAWIDAAELRDDGTLYLAVRDRADIKSVMAVDSSTGEIIAERQVDHYGPLAITSDSVWVATTKDFACLVERSHPGSLAVTATIPIECDIFGSQFAALGDDIWFLDRTTADIDARGGTLRRIDPATNQVGTNPNDAITVPFTNGHLFGSGEAIFWRADSVDESGDRQVYRLMAGAAELEPLGRHDHSLLFPGGHGFWADIEGDSGVDAVYRTRADAPDATLDIEGSLIGGDESAAYVNGIDFDGTPILMRYPIDGTAPTVAATGLALETSAGYQELGYIGGHPLLVENGLVVMYWLVPPPDDADALELVIQTTRLP